MIYIYIYIYENPYDLNRITSNLNIKNWTNIITEYFHLVIFQKFSTLSKNDLKLKNEKVKGLIIK